MHAVADDVLTRKISTRDKTGVRTVQDADLSLLVGSDFRNDVDVETGLLEGKLLLKPGGTFDVPHAEDFADVQKRIVVAVLFRQTGNFLRVADAAGNDAVHERGAEQAVILQPCDEVLAIAPVLRVLYAALLELLAVVVDQLAGEDDDTLLARLEALVQEHGQLRGEGSRRQLVRSAGTVIDDTGLGGVGGDVLEVVALGDLDDFGPILGNMRIVAGVHDGDHALAVDLLAVLAAAEIQGVQTFLLVDELGQTHGDGLHQGDLAVPVRQFVGHIEPVVHERAEKVALAELQDLDRRILQDVAVVAGVFQDFIVKFRCHDDSFPDLLNV